MRRQINIAASTPPRGWWIAYLAFALVVGFPERAKAQAVTGQLEGWVVGEDGAAIAGAAVATRAAGYRERIVVTDETGYFRFLALPPGAYDVNVSFIGRRSVHLDDQSVHLGATTSLGRIVISPQPIELAAISATSVRPVLDPATSTYGSVIAKDVFEYLPIDRDYHNVATVLPHVSNSAFEDGINFAGATGLENHYYVDGSNVTEPVNGWAGLALPYNFVKEIEIRTGGYEAEYRGALGGVMNVVTHSGTNDLRAEAFAFYAGKRFGPEPRQNIREVSRGEYTLYDVGASLAGPIRRDRMWFFAAWNPSFEREDVPLPSLGLFEDKAVSHRFAGKLTWQPGAQTRLELNAAGNPTRRESVGFTAWGLGGGPTRMLAPDPLLAIIKTGATTFSAHLTHFLSPSLLLEISADRSRWLQVQHGRRGDNSEPLFIDRYSVPGEVLWIGGYPEDIDGTIGRTAADVRLTATYGRHTWKIGADLERTYAGADNEKHAYIEHSENGSWRSFEFSMSGDPVVNRGVGLFVQDSWTISDSLRVNFGMRWGTERVFGSDRMLSVRFNNELQPRIGLVFKPGAAGRHKLSASYGRYYEQVPVNGLALTYTFGSRWAEFEYDHDPRIDASGGEGNEFIATRNSNEVEELKGLFFDELALGYERSLGVETKASLRVVRRVLGMALEDGWDNDGNYFFGNPGHGKMGYLPEGERKYTALELSLEHAVVQRAFVAASYVLSRTHGNYPGFFNTDFGYAGPNWNASFDVPDMLPNSTGLLPNDRPHVFKASGWYRTGRFPVTLGASFLWQSGTPLSELGGTRDGRPWFGFASKRGTAGRTPAVRDLNLRAAYRLPALGRLATNSTLLLDLFHVGSSRTPLHYDQQHYYALDERGQQTDVNPDYGRVTAYQAGMTGRIGLQLTF